MSSSSSASSSSPPTKKFRVDPHAILGALEELVENGKLSEGDYKNLCDKLQKDVNNHRTIYRITYNCIIHTNDIMYNTMPDNNGTNLVDSILTCTTRFMYIFLTTDEYKRYVSINTGSMPEIIRQKEKTHWFGHIIDDYDLSIGDNIILFNTHKVGHDDMCIFINQRTVPQLVSVEPM